MRMHRPAVMRLVLMLACLWTWQSSDFSPIRSNHGGFLVSAQQQGDDKDKDNPDLQGPRALAQGHALFEEGLYDQAALAYWRSILFHTQTPPHLKYDLNAAFSKYMECYIVQGKPAEGLAYASAESFRRKQHDMGHQFLQQARAVDPTNEAVLEVQRMYVDKTTTTNTQQQQARKPQQQQQSTSSSSTKSNNNNNKVSIDPNDPLVQSHTPEELYEIGSKHFSDRQYEDCADVFELSCQLSKETLGPSCSNAIYCRTMIVDWGWNGTQFEKDMQYIQELTWSEMLQYRYHGTSPAHTTKIHRFPTLDQEALIPYMRGNTDFQWNRATSVHPHMMLGYPVAPLLKRFVAEAVAFMDEMMARASHSDNGLELPPLPEDLPFQYNPADYTKTSKIRVGFVGSGFNSKAVLYLSHDMFRFFDRDQFEIHIFSFGPPDNPLFIQHGMRGVDWRKRVQSNVHFFHDCQVWKNNHMEAARYIRQQDIHILIEWDGYARQGDRAQGVFKLRPAPVQMLHQEYLGTSGAATHYVDYLFTDETTSPLEQVEHLYTEKLIFLPNHFFSKGHAYQAEVIPPAHEYRPKTTREYQAGTGTPQQNKCLAASNNQNDDEVSFVFCNWNKLLKNNPETVRSWIAILRQVPNSILCLLENPTDGVEYFRKFVHEAAGSVDQAKMDAEGVPPWEAFLPGDGDALNDRIFFLPWEKNPFDHQHRNVDFCNVMLDSWPYNGHTVAQDALYAGVPIVTRSDGLDMSSRVTTSANRVLGLPHLNAWKGPSEYEAIAVELATNATLYHDTRKHLIDTALQRNPMHPYWDVGRYVRNFEGGLRLAWQNFVEGREPEHIHVREEDYDGGTTMGTMDDFIAAHPTNGPYRDNYLIPQQFA